MVSIGSKGHSRDGTMPVGCITATETIDGVLNVLMLAPDDCGRYRVVDCFPDASPDESIHGTLPAR
jgi:hypothetical protein